MLHNSDKNQAAVTAASFSLMLLQAYYSSASGETSNPVITALKAGLTENRTNAEADDLIEELADGEGRLAHTPAQLAARAPEACVKLAELFASALMTGAEGDEMAIIENAVKPRQSEEVSMAFLAMKAPSLCLLFGPR